MKSTLLNCVIYLCFANVSFPSKFPHIRQGLSRFIHPKTCNCFSKISKAKIEIFTNIRMTRNSEKKHKSHDKTTVPNDPGNNTKKIVNLILENAMPKAIIEVYFELLVRFLRSDFLQLLFKVCENYSHHHASSIHYCVCLCKFSRIYQNVFISYMSHQLRTKIMAQLNFVQRLQISNQKSLVTIFIKTVSDVSAHASYKYPVNRCFE